MALVNKEPAGSAKTGLFNSIGANKAEVIIIVFFFLQYWWPKNKSESRMKVWWLVGSLAALRTSRPEAPVAAQSASAVSTAGPWCCRHSASAAARNDVHVGDVASNSLPVKTFPWRLRILSSALPSSHFNAQMEKRHGNRAIPSC